jgi:hypothetical protein
LSILFIKHDLHVKDLFTLNIYGIIFERRIGVMSYER